MPDVFINYRTGDEENTAAFIEDNLSRRFGAEKIFRASRSIEAGVAFPRRLLGAVHGSRALLAVIGPRWADAKGRQRLADEHDWVRRELLAAKKFDVRVIPVLVGDPHVRLRTGDLPAELSWIGNLQYRQFNSRDAEACLDRIAEDLIAFVPGLKPRAAEEHSARNVVHGNVTNISGNHGPVHGGTGHQFNGATTYIAGSEDTR
jgi:hypothetical protein